MVTRINFRFVLAVLTVFIFAGIFSSCSGCNSNTGTQAPQQVSVYDRVMKSGTIRCAYAAYPPASIVDPNTHKLSGIFPEILQEAAKNLGLKVEYTEEVGYGNIIEGLEANRYDMMGTGVWANAARAKRADFTIPLYYSGIGVYVRSNDNRFSNNLKAINAPDVRITTIDAEISALIAATDFPKAAVLSHPQLSDASQILMDVTAGKADVTFADPSFVAVFLKNHPGSLKNITPDRPIRIFPSVFMLKRGDPTFKSMLNTALEELIDNGFVDKVISKYEPAPGSFYRIAYPYRVPEGKAATAASSNERP